MSVIESMEQLEQLNPGQRITLTQQNNANWERFIGDGVDGFKQGEFTVPLDFFLTEVAANGVYMGAIPTVGQMWRSVHDYYVYVDRLEQGGDSDVWFGYQMYADGTVYGEVQTQNPDPDWGAPMEAESWPDWADRVWQDLFANYRNAQVRYRRLNRRHEEGSAASRERINTLQQRVYDLESRIDGFPNLNPDTLQTGLWEWMSDNDIDRDGDLGDLLERLGLNRPPPPFEDVTVEVTIDGYTIIEVDEDNLGFSVDSVTETSSGRVDWSHTFAFEVETPTGQCACDEVTYDMVRSRIEEDYMYPESWEVDESSCPHCN